MALMNLYDTTRYSHYENIDPYLLEMVSIPEDNESILTYKKYFGGVVMIPKKDDPRFGREKLYKSLWIPEFEGWFCNDKDMIDIFCEQRILRYTNSMWVREDDVPYNPKVRDTHVSSQGFLNRILVQCPITLHTYFSEESKTTINIFILCINRLNILPIELILKIKNYMGEINYIAKNDGEDLTENDKECRSIYTRDGIYLPEVDGWTFPRKYGLDLINSSYCYEEGIYTPLTNQFKEINRRMKEAGVYHP